MGVTIYVQDFRGDKLHGDSVEMRGVLSAAEERGLPFLTSVDVYDNTTFNRKQTVRLAEELNALSGAREDLGEAIASLRAAITVVAKRPHRYLVFNGD